LAECSDVNCKKYRVFQENTVFFVSFFAELCYNEKNVPKGEASVKKLLWICVFVICLMFWTTAAPDTAELDLSKGSISFSGSGGSVTAQQNGSTVTAARFRILQSGSKTENTVSVISGTVELVLSNLNAESADAPVSVASGASLTAVLEGDNALWSTGSAGIRVPSGAALSLGGNGTLIAVGRNHSAGIGGGFREDGGSVTITGGTITATGVGAGIGGGTGSKGDVTITGGNVTANGGGLSAGIGGGYGDTRVTITGGTVFARGSSSGTDGGGAGIGNCNYGSGAVITITGGDVTAKGGPGGGAGIGGGDHGAAGSVIITDATITAVGGGFSAGIGGGARSTYDSGGGHVVIENASGSITGYYSAIGGGSTQNAHGCDSISLLDSSITAARKDTSGLLYNERLPQPAILGPLQQSAAEGKPTSLQVFSEAPSGFTCQWQASPNGTTDWVDLPGQTAAVSDFSITAAESGRYVRCRVTNAYGSSAYAGPIRVYALTYTQMPSSVRMELGSFATLTAASSTPNVTWLWERSTDFGQTYAVLSGETGSSLQVSLTEETADALYRCGIIATNGDVLYSEPARVCTETASCFYREILYLQELDGSYTVAKQEQIEATAGSRVFVEFPAMVGFEQNTSLGKTMGTVKEDCSLVLAVYYDRVFATLFFETNGAANLESITAMYGAAVTLPSVTTEGAEFGGWFTDRERTIPAELTQMPERDMMLYALWKVDDAARGLEYRISGMLLFPDRADDTATIPSGSFTARVYIKNISSLCTDHVILTVHDKDGRQLEMYWETVTSIKGLTTEVSFRVENTGGKASTITAYILSSGPSMKPLTQRAIFGSEPLLPQ